VENPFHRGMTPARSWALRWGVLVLVWVPMAALIIWGRGGVLDLFQLRREVANLQAEIDTLKQENEGLRGEIRRLQTDPATYEGPARELLFRKKKGEVVLYLPPAGSAPKVPPPPANAPDANAPAVSPPSNALATEAPAPRNAPAANDPPPSPPPANAPAGR
jgi:cell division protein FtsB